MDHSESRIAPSPEAASDDSASLSNQPSKAAELAGQARPGGSGAVGGGSAGETADRLAFEPVPLRYREDGLTPERQRAYVEALADTGVAREAAARVGLSEQAIARVRRRSDARSFDSACEAAHMFGARRLRSIAYDRAVEGTLKGHYYHGERISEERVYDNRLLIYLLGKTGPLLDAPDEDSLAICRNWEPSMEALERGAELPVPAPGRASAPAQPEREDDDPQVWLEDGIWWTFFPPPEGFDGEEEGELGEADYQRTLTAEEQEAMKAKQPTDDAAELVRCCAVRDRFFGLAGDADSSSREAEPYETSEPDPGPIEYKSALPPKGRATETVRGSDGGSRGGAEARRRGGAARFIPVRSVPPATAGSHVRSAAPEEPPRPDPFRVPAPPRELDAGAAARTRPAPGLHHIQSPPPRHPC